MRIRTVILGLGLVLPLTLPVMADPQSHCEVYSKDFADSRTANVDKWQLLYRGAFQDCMMSYNAKPSSDAPVAADVAPAAADAAPEVVNGPETPDAPELSEEPPVKKAAAKPKVRKVAARRTTSRVAAKNLVPGTDAWNAFCAAKYTSFNKQSGTYLSNSGKIRRCSTTR